MALFLIATPIGDPKDITLRAIETLASSDVVIGEEYREVTKLLKALNIEGKNLELLNEHSRPSDVTELLNLCRTSRVALVSDCGTPGFCDPGSRLVAACRKEGILVTPRPGASSLMCLLSVVGCDLPEFKFRGFLPAERETRHQALRTLQRETQAVVLMDTPYRLTRLLQELADYVPERTALLGCDFTQSTEVIYEALCKDLPAIVGERKAEFILMLAPLAERAFHSTSQSPGMLRTASRSSTNDANSKNTAKPKAKTETRRMPPPPPKRRR